MRRLPLNTLPAFVAVARSCNMRSAADELHLTHSAVSQQIQLLEEQLGFALFERRGRRIVLNAAGSALLRSAEAALAELDDGARAAAALAAGTEHRLRVTLLPSFAQRWFLPRMTRWRERHPHIAIELHTSHQLVDVQREGFHAALRQGRGPWRGLEAERLLDSRLVVVGSPAAARRLRGRDVGALADEPLLGGASRWEAWFSLAGAPCKAKPVAAFNDAGLMLQAVEQDLGIALARELLAADALCDGRLVRLSPLALPDDEFEPYWFAYPPQLKDWPPLVALHAWLREELDSSAEQLATQAPAPSAGAPVGLAAAEPSAATIAPWCVTKQRLD